MHCSLLGLPTGAAECLDFLHGETGISDFMRGKSGFQELVHHQYCSSLLGLALISSMVKLGFQELVHHCSSLLGAAACLDFETWISGSPLLQRQPDILAFMRGETWISGVGAPPSWCTIRGVQKIQKLSETPATAHRDAKLCINDSKNKKKHEQLVQPVAPHLCMNPKTQKWPISKMSQTY